MTAPAPVTCAATATASGAAAAIAPAVVAAVVTAAVAFADRADEMDDVDSAIGTAAGAVTDTVIAATAPAVAPPADGGDFTEEKSDERNETVAPLAPSTELREGLAPAVAELSTDSAGPTGLLLASLDLRTRNSV